MSELALLSLKQVATILGVSTPRVYQMDDVLEPVVTRRGSKSKTRRYRPDVIARVAAERSSKNSTIPLPAEEFLFGRLERSSSARGIGFELALEDFMHIACLPCLFCGSAPVVREIQRGMRAGLNHIVRLVHDQGFSHDNAAPCCDPCVSAMGDLDARTYIARCRQIVAWQEHLGFF